MLTVFQNFGLHKNAVTDFRVECVPGEVRPPMLAVLECQHAYPL